jgi:hypothetical protein
MNKGKVKWVLLTLVVILGLGLIIKPLPRQRARAQRIQTVNGIGGFSATMPITKAQPAARANK